MLGKEAGTTFRWIVQPFLKTQLSSFRGNYWHSTARAIRVSLLALNSSKVRMVGVKPEHGAHGFGAGRIAVAIDRDAGGDTRTVRRVHR